MILESHRFLEHAVELSSESPEDVSEYLSIDDAASSASDDSTVMEEEIDPDAPRVAQWEPDDFEVNSDPEDEDSDASEEEDQPEEKTAGSSQVHLVSVSRDRKSRF